MFFYNKGHEIGDCFVNTQFNICFIPIPKNASTMFKECVMQNEKDKNWVKTNFITQNFNKDKYRYVVILRDPFKRWVSGVAEYLSLYNKKLELTKEVLDFIFHQIVLDDHTVSQLVFIEGIPNEKIDFLNFDDDLTDNIKKFCIQKLDKDYHIENETFADKLKEQIKEKVITFSEYNRIKKRDIDLYFSLDRHLYENTDYFRG